MNKKLTTLGVAAAVGLAGLVALPVLAAGSNTWLKKPGFVNPKAVVVTVAGANKYLATAGENYGNSGVITVTDDSDETLVLATLKEALKGKKADKEGKPQDTAAAAELEANWATPEVKAIDTIQLNGKFTALAKVVKATATAINAEGTKDEYKNLKNLNLAVSDTDAELEITDLKDAVDILKELSGVKMNIYTVQNVNKLKIGAALTYALVKDYGNRIAFNNGANIKSISVASPALNLIEALGLGSNWKETVTNYYERDGGFAGLTTPGTSNKDKDDKKNDTDEKEKNADKEENNKAAGDKTNKPNGTLRAPNTGIAE